MTNPYTLFMHIHTGDVRSRQEWIDDYNNDFETGIKTFKQWTNGKLIEVEIKNDDWVESEFAEIL